MTAWTLIVGAGVVIAYFAATAHIIWYWRDVAVRRRRLAIVAAFMIVAGLALHIAQRPIYPVNCCPNTVPSWIDRPLACDYEDDGLPIEDVARWIRDHCEGR